MRSSYPATLKGFRVHLPHECQIATLNSPWQCSNISPYLLKAGTGQGCFSEKPVKVLISHSEDIAEGGESNHGGSFSPVMGADFLTAIAPEKAASHLSARFSADIAFLLNGKIRKASGCIQPVGRFKSPGGARVQASGAGAAPVLDWLRIRKRDCGGGKDFHEKQVGSIAGDDQHIVLPDESHP